jgi:predicted MPP superfamily phosphohydrolase
VHALPSPSGGGVRIVVLSDTHERHHLFGVLPVCDILIHCGDVMMLNRIVSTQRGVGKLREFNEWLGLQPAEHKIVIGGNHDKVMEDLGVEQCRAELSHAIYLCNSSVSVCGLTVFGSPISQGKSKNRAFQGQQVHVAAEAAAKAQQIDILITHGPSCQFALDVRPRLIHISGHAHERYGIRRIHCREPGKHPQDQPDMEGDSADVADVALDVSVNNADGERGKEWLEICAPIMDVSYNPTNVPIVFDINLT